MSKKLTKLEFPGSPVVKNLPANTADTGLIPGPGRFHRGQATRPVCRNYWAIGSGALEPQLLNLERPKACALWWEKPLEQELDVHHIQSRAEPLLCSLQLEKAPCAETKTQQSQKIINKIFFKNPKFYCSGEGGEEKCRFSKKKFTMPTS